jgi:hypothetical protein
MLVDRHYKSLLGAPVREPSQQEVEPVPAEDHGLDGSARLDMKPFRRPALEVALERGRPHGGVRSSCHRSSALPSSPPSKTLIAQRPRCKTSWREPTWKNNVSTAES